MTEINGTLEHPNIIKALEHLNSVLVAGETLEAWTVQRRLFALSHRRMLIAATSGRFIKIQRGIFGGFEMTDFRWQDLGDSKIKVGIFGADILMKIFVSTDLAISENSTQELILKGFRKEQTQQIYRLAQAHDQSWREKRRIRELEELRAKSGGITLGNSSSTHQGAISPEDPVAKLKQAKQMLDDKLITDSEYESIKARLISGF
jgi:hypothetical protein